MKTSVKGYGAVGVINWQDVLKDMYLKSSYPQLSSRIHKVVILRIPITWAGKQSKLNLLTKSSKSVVSELRSEFRGCGQGDRIFLSIQVSSSQSQGRRYGNSSVTMISK
jgi:hypothetical protein